MKLTMLKEWLLRHEVSSECLREEMAHWVMWLSNDSPPFAAYRVVNSARILAADKKPGVRPLACGEIWMRLWADCLNTETKAGATTACGNVNLCAGLGPLVVWKTRGMASSPRIATYFFSLNAPGMFILTKAVLSTPPLPMRMSLNSSICCH